MTAITIKGRTIMEGDVQGEAIISKEPLSLGYVDSTGIVSDKGHPLYGQRIGDRILVSPGLKGSATQDVVLAGLVQNGGAPKGIIVLEADARLIAAAIFCEIPVMDKLEKNPLEAISTGDFVRINADEGIVEVEK